MNKNLSKAVLVAAFLFGTGLGVVDGHADSYVTDVSSYQGVINYKANGFNGVIIKAGGGEGTGGNYINPYVGAQQAEARREGIQHGYYYYLTSHLSPEQQARQFYNILGPEDARNKDIPVFVDVEENAWDGNHFRGDEPKRFMDEFYRLSGKKVNVYMNFEMATGMHGRFEWSDIKDAKLWLALYPSSNNTQYYGQAWANQKFAQIPWFKTVDMWQYGDGGGFDRNMQYGDWSNLTGHKYTPSNPVPKTIPPAQKPKPKPATQKYATFNNVYVVNKWIKWNNKWYVTNNDFSIPIEDYNNWIPAGPVTLTDRYGHKLKNQLGQGNNGKMEFFTLNGKYKVLAQDGNNIKLDIGGEPVWLKNKFVTVK
ncbi:GH25 family lysozyme [Weissella viridescens]|uniref:GH25 family lysozyme n=1 Tax=Weissella viridescens TaxID=1629 RepID=UPI003AF2679B